ncbi:MAG: SDR family NAD(P)-dependent oxidoreductase [Verrucomicrobiae bacterium]|nr:SDR family NAD(P)-dependent oxidoreductase [Verrucomicrobiae bacterium]
MRDRVVVVTGAGGFIGSHLAEHLVREGARVRAFVHYRSDGGLGWLGESPLARDMEIIAGDIREPERIREACRGAGAVFHLAALVGIPYSKLSPAAYIATNVMGTHHVLDAAREGGASSIVVVSTSEVYGSARRVPMDEEHPTSAQSPYAATKIAAEQLALSYHRAFGLPVRVVRPFNAYGPRQSARAVIPAVIAQFAAGVRPVRVGNVDPTRDFTFVTDTVKGLVAASGCAGLGGEIANVGSGAEVSIEAMIVAVAGLMGVAPEWVSNESQRRSEGMEVSRLCCDASKVRRLTGWVPQVEFAEGLRETIGWIRSNLGRYRPGQYAV